MRISQLKRPSLSGAIVLAVLVALTALGVGTGIYRLLVGLGRSTNLTDAYPWGLWIGFDFSLIAFSGGAFTLCAIITIFNQRKCRPVERMIILTGWLGYVSVLVVLLMDLGRPDRFYHFLIYPNVHSPLFEISWCVLLYSAVLTLEFAPAVFEGLRKPHIAKTIHSFMVPIAIAGVTLSTLHQSTLGTLYLALPAKLHTLWHSALLPIFFLVSSVGMGLSTVILVTLIGYKAFRRPITDDIRRVLQAMAKASIWVWGLYLVLKVEDLIAADQLGEAFAFDTQSLWFLAELLIGVVLPIALFAQRRVRESEVGLATGAVFATIGTAMNRFNATLTGQTVAEGASYTPHWIELAIQFGILAAGILAWYLVATFLPIFEDDREPASTGAQH